VQQIFGPLLWSVCRLSAAAFLFHLKFRQLFYITLSFVFCLYTIAWNSHTQIRDPWFKPGTAHISGLTISAFELWLVDDNIVNFIFMHCCFRFSSALEIQLPQLALCCKMNLTFKLRSVIIALLYSLSLTLIHTQTTDWYTF
jgi:hypothetical protein